MFVKRFISAVILLAFAAIALVTGGDFLLAASAVVAIGGTYEILKVDSLHKTPLGAVSYIAAAGYYVMLYLEKQQYFTLWIVFMLILLLTSYVFSYPKYDAKQVGLAFLPLVYVAVLISFVYQTRELPYGNWFVWLIIIGASGSDTFAYLTGMLIGSHHFSELSPKKTIEGCVGGVLGTAVLALVYSFFLPEGVDTLFGVNVHILLLICGAVCSIVSQIGDLAASAIKRNYGIKDYLQSTSFDTLQMQPTNKNDLYSRRRYMFSLVSDYYEADFDYSTVVKISHIPEENPLDIPEKEKKYILLRQKSPQQYYTNIRLLIEHNKILEYLKEHIAQNYHLNKRSEIFLDLASLYEQGHYQSFIALGILQLEGLFFDICSIKYDYKENAGTLVEKADKALKSRSKIRFMKYYPYFAFDVPVMRNEIAHIGLTNSQNIEQKADELLLDLNAVARMAIMESEEKFRFFIDIYSKLSQTGFNDIEAVNHELVCELLADNMIAPDSFWDVLKCPSNFKEEIEFYKQDNAQKGIVDLPTMVYTISEMVYQLPFWSEMVKSIDLEYNTDYFNQFLLFMAKNYIANLDDDCKKQCVEILKTLQ